MQDNLGGLERTSLPNTTAGTTNTRSAAEIDEEYNLHVSLLGLAVMPSNDDNHDGRHHQHGHDDYNKAGEEDEDEDEDDDEEMEEVSPRASSHKTNNLERFLYMFKATNKIKSLRIDSFGTFSIPAGLELQFIGQYQPIPDGLKSSFTMFGEHWTSQINYVAVDGGDTALQFSVCNLRTMKTTSLVETRDERKRRRANKRVMLICSKTFDLAWRQLEGKQYSGQGGTKESATLFGLKDASMRDFVCHWYAEERLL